MTYTSVTARSDLTPDRIRDLLHYDPSSGQFTWLLWSRGKLNTPKPAGTINHEGYRRIQIDGEIYQAGQLAWFYMTGAWPVAQIDHRNRDTGDDRWTNLRAATPTQNKANSGVYKNNLIRVKGVRLHRNGQYEARLRVNGQLRYIGCFRTIADAKAAYDAAAMLHFGEFASSG